MFVLLSLQKRQEKTATENRCVKGRLNNEGTSKLQASPSLFGASQRKENSPEQSGERGQNSQNDGNKKAAWSVG